jgi:glycosyltransferase involved in cell wall biosynthesis
MWVDSSQTGDWTVSKPSTNIDRAKQLVRKLFARIILNKFQSSNPIIHSPSIMSSNWPKYINASDADVVNLHWVQGEMLSIKDIGLINKPIVWTLHDMWAFCGAEHYTEEYLWRDGYSRGARTLGESGINLNRWRWKKKKKLWKTPFHIVSPSNWLSSCVSQSSLMGNWPSRVIPNPIDFETWQPVDKTTARKLLNLPQSPNLILFGALGGSSDSRKGFDLLQSALSELESHMTFLEINIEIIVLGQLKPKIESDLGFKVHYLGHLFDDLSLRNVYSAADVVVVPSRQDNLPNVCLEALSCGTPIVSFKVGGFEDIIKHGVNGYLAEPFDPKDLATGMIRVLNLDAKKQSELSEMSRLSAKENFNPREVSKLYIKTYEDAIATFNKNY